MRTRLLVAALALAGGACTVSFHVGASPSAPAPSPTIAAKTAEAHGVSFAYPASWHELAAGPGEGSSTLDITVSPDDESFVRVQRFPVLMNVTPERLPTLRGQLRKLVVRVAAQLNGRVVNQLTRDDTAGHPGYRATLSVSSAKGNPATEILYIFFSATDEYTLGCEYTAATKAEVLGACDLARTTFSAPAPT